MNLFVSKGLMDLAQTYGTVPGMGVLPNGVKQNQEAPLPYTGGEKIFLFAARMEAVKGPLLLSKPFADLKDRKLIAGMRFLLVGGARFIKKSKRKWPGTVSGRSSRWSARRRCELMAGLYRSSYALVLPSVCQGISATILEAGTFGVPAIATRTIGNSDAMVDGETGLLFALENPPLIS